VGKGPEASIVFVAAETLLGCIVMVISDGSIAVVVVVVVVVATANGQQSNLSLTHPTTSAQRYAVKTSIKVHSAVAQYPVNRGPVPFHLEPVRL
jgi:hypothetical protein